MTQNTLKNLYLATGVLKSDRKQMNDTQEELEYVARMRDGLLKAQLA